MFDNTPLVTEELIDQCRALSHAVVTLDDQAAKEILTYLLWERIDVLHTQFLEEQSRAGPAGCDLTATPLR